jgi:hypothetical protein
MAIRKPKRKKAAVPNVIRTHSLAPEDVTTLERLSYEASDRVGWTVSSSAVVRALVRYAERHLATWVREQLFPLIEEEIGSGVVWGSRKK